jgi:hypothetical protein
MTEYSGIRFLIFFIAEFAAAGAFAAIASTLFLGGWAVPVRLGLGSLDNIDNWMNVARPAHHAHQDDGAHRHHLLGPVQLPPLP